jgi:DNA-binding NarL/FixJ family response regulator
MTLRVVIAEDNALLREGLRGLISAVDDLSLVATCASLDELFTALDTHAPDVVLTDIRMPPTRSDEGLQAARHCRRHFPGTGVVLLSQFADPGYVKALLEDGAEGRGYLLKERVGDVAELVSALRTVAAGGSVVDPKVVEALVQSGSRRGNADLDRLSTREREVLGQMALGRNNAAIATSLFITQRAVEKHINSIFAKLGVGVEDQAHPRVRAVLMYLSDGAS